jgi:hypothetical protein
MIYHQKLVRIFRDKHGNFERFEDANLKDINHTN